MARNQRKKSRTVKITHVYDTRDKEKVWFVKMDDGTKQTLTKQIIFKKKLLTKETTWSYLRVGCKCRLSVGFEFRYVFWKGFTEPTKEPLNFKPQDEETDDDDDDGVDDDDAVDDGGSVNDDPEV
jgi:hypothetical protein